MNRASDITLKHGKFNIVFGGQAGSEGKGKVACRIVYDHLGIEHDEANPIHNLILACNHMPNAGHTFRDDKLGIRYVAKQLPTPAIFNNNLYDLKHKIPVVIGPGSSIRISILEKEIEQCGLEPGNTLFIHPNAGIVTDEHIAAEGVCMDNISSTKQGGGACIAAKVMRQPGKDGILAIAKHLLPEHLRPCLMDTSEYLNSCMDSGSVVLFEGAQGFDLDINHGLDYPYTTSRMCNVSSALAESGIPPTKVGSRIAVIRPYPIRVGNVKDKDGKITGYSGDYAVDNGEVDWEYISMASGSPKNLDLTELTTVTGKIRRVFTFSRNRYLKLVRTNDITDVVISFVDYIDYNMYGKQGCDLSDLSNNTRYHFDNFLYYCGIDPSYVSMLSCGPDNSHIIYV